MKELNHHCIYCKKDFYNLARHLINDHQITAKQYFDENILTINQNICKDENCTNITRFKSITKGYSSYCSSKCNRKNISTRMIDKHKNDEEYSKGISERMSNLHKNEDFKKRASNRGTTSLKILHQNKNFVHKFSRGSWLSHCKKRKILIGYLYLAIFDNSCKIGLTYHSNAAERLRKIKCKNSILYKGSIESVANMEFLIKESFESIKKTEWFNIEHLESIKLLITSDDSLLNISNN